MEKVTCNYQTINGTNFINDWEKLNEEGKSFAPVFGCMGSV